MAREILLRLKTRNYERAKTAAERIKKRADETLQKAKGLRDQLRQSVEKAREMAELRRRGAALGERGAAASRRDLGAISRGRFESVLGSVGRAREIGEGAASIFGSGDITSMLPSLLSGAAQFIPGVGPFAALLAPLTEKLLGYIDERFEQEIKKREALFLARLEEGRFRDDFTRRLEEDPAFAFKQAKLALKETLATEKRFKKRVHTAADLLAESGL